MMNGARARVSLLLGCVAAILSGTGCGPNVYKVHLEPDPVFNAWGGDNTAERMFVDVVRLDAEDVKRRPELARGDILSNEWFLDRWNNRTPKEFEIYALRDRDTPMGEYGDVLVGGPLEPSNPRPVTVEVPADGTKLILVYGRFIAQNNQLAQSRPLVVDSSDFGWFDKKEVHVGAGRTSLRRGN